MTASLKQVSDQLQDQAENRLKVVAAAYTSGMRQIDISRSMDLSPTIINRLIKRARQRGILS